MKNDYDVDGNIGIIYLRRRDGTTLETKIDAVDMEKVMQYPVRWYANYDNRRRQYRANGDLFVDGKKKKLNLARIVMDAPSNVVVDHINHDTLNNCKNNLRLATISENGQNRKGPQTNNKSGELGISWRQDRNKWQAHIKLAGKKIYLGVFKDFQDACEAVKNARAEYMPFSQEALQAKA